MGFFSFFSKEKKETLDKGLSKTKESVFSKIARAVAGKSKVDDEVLDNLEEVLITSDVGVETTLNIIKRIEKRAAEDKYVNTQELNHILRDEIAALLTENNSGDIADFDVAIDKKPYVIMVVRVNGVGKTTTIGKLAYQFKKAGKSVYLGAADTFRAAAVEQLMIWGERVGVPVIKQKMGADPASVAYDTLSSAVANNADIVIIDTAGRLHIDEDMMAELQEIKEVVKVHQTILVVDAMTGQDAVNAAQSFNEWLDIDSVMLSKLDGDARGGAALSVRAITGKPIKFAGIGEKLEDIEPFHPDRMASRILGMGDVLTLIEKAEKAYDAKKAAEMEEKLKSNRFTLQDFYDQMVQMQSMGSMEEILAQMPGGGNLKGVKLDEKAMAHTEAIILSMTPKEREKPEIIGASRKKRIAAGAGLKVEDVNRLLKSFEQMRKLIKQFSGPGAGKKMKRMGRMGGFGGFPGF